MCLVAGAAGCKRSESLPQRTPSEKFGQLIIRVHAPNLPVASPVQVKADSDVCGKEKVPNQLRYGENHNLLDVVVWLEGERVLGWPEAFEGEAAFTAKNCELNPRVLIIPPRGSIRFYNLDPILHTYRAQGVKNYPSFRSHPPQLENVSIRLDHPEILPVYSDLHPWMKAFVVVAPHQNYAITDGKGEAVIRKIPRGTLQLKLWHPVLGMYPEAIQIEVNSAQVERTVEWN